MTGNVLGKGQFGEVILAKQKDDIDPQKRDPSKAWMACKIINKKSLNPRLTQNLKNEINILSQIDQKNIIKLFDIQKTTNNFYLFMQYCNFGDLEKLREIRGKFTEAEARYFLS